MRIQTVVYAESEELQALLMEFLQSKGFDYEQPELQPSVGEEDGGGV